MTNELGVLREDDDGGGAVVEELQELVIHLHAHGDIADVGRVDVYDAAGVRLACLSRWLPQVNTASGSADHQELLPTNRAERGSRDRRAAWCDEPPHFRSTSTRARCLPVLHGPAQVAFATGGGDAVGRKLVGGRVGGNFVWAKDCQSGERAGGADILDLPDRL